MITVGSPIIWKGWSGVVCRIAKYGVHCDWDGIAVPETHACGIPGPITAYPHVPITELCLRTPGTDDNEKKKERQRKLAEYSAFQKARFAEVNSGTAVTWTIPAEHWCAAARPGTLEHFKGKFLRVEGGHAIVQDDRWAETMAVKLMDVQIV